MQAMAAQLVQQSAEETMEQLAEVSADTERLQIWRQLEEKMVRSVRQAQDVLPQHIRVQTIEYVVHLATEVCLPCETIFSTIALLDLALLRMGYATAGTQLPELSSAMVCVSKKMENVDGTQIRSCDLVQKTREFAQQLRSQGEMNSRLEIAMEDIGNAELTLAATLQWQFNVPSIHQWLNLLVDRIAVIFPRATDISDWLYQKCIVFAQQIAFKHILYKRAFPQEVAQGLFCTGLALAGIVPVETLCPAGLDEDVWKAQWQNQQVWPGTAATNAMSLIPAEIAGPFLELVTHTSVQVLQTATLRSIAMIWA